MSDDVLLYYAILERDCLSLERALILMYCFALNIYIIRTSLL